MERHGLVASQSHPLNLSQVKLFFVCVSVQAGQGCEIEFNVHRIINKWLYGGGLDEKVVL